jgi:hypothetical protein
MKERKHFLCNPEVLTRFDRIALHLHCLLLDRKCRWHLAGIWREVMQH